MTDTKRNTYVRAPIGLLQAVALILHSLAVDQANDGQYRNSSMSDGLANQLDRITGKGAHQ